MIKMTYDVTVDAFAIQLRSPTRGEHVRTVSVAPGVGVDLTDDGRVVALEVLDASYHIPRAQLEQLASPKRYLTLTEAAKESGLAPATLRGQIRNSRIAAIKRGRDWLVDATALLNYLESRAPSGRPAKASRSRRAPAKKVMRKRSVRAA